MFVAGTLTPNAAPGRQNNNRGAGTQFVADNQFFFEPSSRLGSNNSRLQKATEQKRKEKKACLGSLFFRQMDDRANEIPRPFDSTCEWLFKTREFQQWRDGTKNPNKNKPVLWIKGNPGVGKSTLMKRTLKYFQEEWQDTIIASCFFSARGATLERSAMGMLRMILYQIIDQDEDICELFLATYRERVRNVGGWKKWKWRESELKEFLTEDFPKLKPGQGELKPLLLIIDALDECRQTECEKIRDILHELGTNAAKHRKATLKICLASRPYPNITMQKTRCLTMERKDGHMQDISKYIKQYIKENLNFQYRELECEIRRDICHRAAGIFLWVRLVLLELQRAHDSGKAEPRTLSRIVQDLPLELEEVFMGMLTQGPSDRRETICILRWVLFAKQPLTPRELYLATVVGTDAESLRLSDPSSIADDNISRRITSASRGLVEIRGGRKKTTRLIHETVRNFLLEKGGLAVLDPDLSQNAVGKSHDFLKYCCMEYLRLHAFPNTPNTGSLLHQYPFLEYASRNVVYHAEEARLTRIPQYGFISFLGSETNLEGLRNSRRTLEGSAFPPSAIDLSISAPRRFHEFNHIALYCGEIVAVNNRDTYSTALQAALINGNTEIVTILRARMAASEQTALGTINGLGRRISSFSIDSHFWLYIFMILTLTLGCRRYFVEETR